MARPIESCADTRLSVDAVGTVLGRDHGAVFGDRPTATERARQRFTATVAVPSRSGVSITHPVEIAVDRIHRDPAAARVELRWRPTAHRSLLPSFRGELVAEPNDAGGSRLRLTGSYEAPFGRLGRVFDATVGHRVARRTVDALLDHLVGRVESAARSATTSPHAPTDYAEDLRSRSDGPTSA